MADKNTGPKRVLSGELLDEAFEDSAPLAEAAERQDALSRAALSRPGDFQVAPSLVRWRERPTRLVDLVHAIDLAGSIAVLGLIEPIAVDRSPEPLLLAGGHRLLAVLLLDAPAGDREALLERLAAHIAPVKPALGDEIRARLLELPRVPQPLILINRIENDQLLIEIAENEKRRDYTRAEIVILAKRLREAGYSFKRGRKGKNDKTLSGHRALETATGKSATTLWRILHPEAKEAPGKVRRGPSLQLPTVLTWIGSVEDEAALKAMKEAIQARLKVLG